MIWGDMGNHIKFKYFCSLRESGAGAAESGCGECRGEVCASEREIFGFFAHMGGHIAFLQTFASALLCVFLPVLLIFLSGLVTSAEALSEVESEKYRELFKLYSDIEFMESTRLGYASELSEIAGKIAVLDIKMANTTEELEELLADYAEVLRERQKHGEGAVVKVLLGSKNLGDFFLRMRIAETISSAYSQVVSRVEEKYAEEALLRSELAQSREALEEKTAELKASIAEKKVRAEALEDYLSKLGGEREEYEQKLDALSKKWEKLKPMFAGSVQIFKELIEAGGLPDEVGEVHISLAGVHATIREDVFNTMLHDALKNKSGVTEMVFDFVEDGINIEIAEHGVRLYGKFEVRSKSLVYTVERGVFNEIEMGKSAIDDLFFGGKLEFDLSTLIGNMELRDCRLYDGYIDIGIKLY